MPFYLTERLWADAALDERYYDALRVAVAPHADRATDQQGNISLRALPSLCCAAAGADKDRAAAVSEAWTVLYAALHILDSVEDADAVNAAWAEWGMGAALNLSTGLIASTSLVLCALEQTTMPADAAHDLRHRFFQTLLQMAAGQHADLTLFQPTLDQCWQIAAAKSGAWFALACYAGARAATADLSCVEHMRQFGHHLGLLVQIGDDLDGLWGRPGTHSDLVNWPRWTLPTAYTMGVVDEEKRKRLQDYLRAAPTDPVAETEARRMIVEAGAVLYLTIEAHQHQQGAQAALFGAVPPSKARDTLLQLLQTYTPLAKS